MGQIKNIKLHIVTDIKLTSQGWRTLLCKYTGCRIHNIMAVSNTHVSVNIKLDQEWKNNGKFICTPKICNEDWTYTDYLVDLNNHFRKRSGHSFLPKVGDYVAVHTSINEDEKKDELWYRGKVQQLFPQSAGGGTMVKMLLVD